MARTTARESRRPSLFAALFTYAFCTIVGVGFVVMVAIQFGWVPPLWLGPGLNRQVQAAPTTAPRPPVPGGGTLGVSSAPRPASTLPDCATVQDSRTACQGAAPAAAPAPQPIPTPVYCEDVLASAGISSCQWRDAEQARQLQQDTERAALQLWIDMAGQAVEEDLRAPATTPTAEVPTECANPTTDRARAACELIKRGIIHPKG